MLDVLAEANTSAGTPSRICSLRAELDPRFNTTSTSGFSSSKDASTSAKASVSEAAADTSNSPSTDESGAGNDHAKDTGHDDQGNLLHRYSFSLTVTSGRPYSDKHAGVRAIAHRVRRPGAPRRGTDPRLCHLQGTSTRYRGGAGDHGEEALGVSGPRSPGRGRVGRPGAYRARCGRSESGHPPGHPPGQTSSRFVARQPGRPCQRHEDRVPAQAGPPPASRTGHRYSSWCFSVEPSIRHWPLSKFPHPRRSTISSCGAVTMRPPPPLIWRVSKGITPVDRAQMGCSPDANDRSDAAW